MFYNLTMVLASVANLSQDIAIQTLNGSAFVTEKGI